MAVEARHLNLFPSHLLCTREMAVEAPMPVMNNQLMNPAMKDDSGLTFNNTVALPFPRKRPREAMVAGNATTSFSLLGDDFSMQMMQQQLEVNRLISLHMERVKSEIDSRRRSQSRHLIASINSAVASKLREKDEQISQISKLNSAMEERLRSLYLENQIWRDLAQSNEATATALRSNLEQILSQNNNKDADAESSCGSTSSEQVPKWRKVERKAVERNCRKCMEKESSVLVLPCRHLCLCSCCGPSVDTCPICNGNKNASVNVNFS